MNEIDIEKFNQEVRDYINQNEDEFHKLFDLFEKIRQRRWEVVNKRNDLRKQNKRLIQLEEGLIKYQDELKKFIGNNPYWSVLAIEQQQADEKYLPCQHQNTVLRYYKDWLYVDILGKERQEEFCTDCNKFVFVL